jgi:hypothetical protein
MDLERDDHASNSCGCPDHDRNDAVTWVHMTDGLRRYFCADCVQEIFRHATDPEDLDEHPTCAHCRSCGKLTLRENCPVNACPECRSDGHTEEYLEAVENAADEFSEAQTELTDEDGVTVVADE